MIKRRETPEEIQVAAAAALTLWTQNRTYCVASAATEANATCRSSAPQEAPLSRFLPRGPRIQDPLTH